MTRYLKFGFILATLALAGCETLSKGGEKVQIVRVTTNVQEVEAAEAKLVKDGCTFVKNIEAPIAAGSTNESYRLEIGLKNATDKAGGNVVISSMEAHMGMPIFTKGKVYKCNRDMTSSEV